jgi:hypothetical protein
MPEQPQIPLQQQMAHAQQQAADLPADRDPTPVEWGRILSFVVDSRLTGNDPESTSTHLFTMVQVGMQLPRAIERLGKTTIDELRFQLVAAKLHPDVSSSPYFQKISILSDMLDNPAEVAWIEEVLDYIREIQGALQRAQAGELQSPPEEAPQPELLDPQEQDQDLSPEQFAARARGIKLDPAPPQSEPTAQAEPPEEPEASAPPEDTEGQG